MFRLIQIFNHNFHLIYQIQIITQQKLNFLSDINPILLKIDNFFLNTSFEIIIIRLELILRSFIASEKIIMSSQSLKRKFTQNNSQNSSNIFVTAINNP